MQFGMKIFIAAILLTAALNATAQVRFHVGGGLGVAGMSNVTSSNDIFSYNIGGGADIHLGRVFSICPSVYICRKGTNFDGYYGTEQIDKATFSVLTEYLEIPLLAGFDIHLKNNSAFVLTVGPHLSGGLNGKAKVKMRNSDYKYTSEGSVFDNTCDFGGNAYNNDGEQVEIPRFNRWDLGLMLGVAYEMRHFRIGLVYAHTITESATSHFEVRDSNAPSYPDDLYYINYNLSTPRNHTFRMTFDYIL